MGDGSSPLAPSVPLKARYRALLTQHWAQMAFLSAGESTKIILGTVIPICCVGIGGAALYKYHDKRKRSTAPISDKAGSPEVNQNFVFLLYWISYYISISLIIPYCLFHLFRIVRGSLFK